MQGLEKPRWNHGLSHVGHVGHASPGDHHGIDRRLGAGQHWAFVFCLAREHTNSGGSIMTIFMFGLGAALVVMILGIDLAISKDILECSAR